ncbi:hypothetical protein DH2020_038526 [Rehmannia glutinosa]|uniref:Uncharacterized protein n=1 Tax=Rehmannia glutinosa TaxID=99300 RepID=A0ABR0V087_REHGL
MEAEPWEALDLDDSDIPHLLRPCKRRRSASPTTTAASAANPISQSPSFQSLEEHSPNNFNGNHRLAPLDAALFLDPLDQFNLRCFLKISTVRIRAFPTIKWTLARILTVTIRVTASFGAFSGFVSNGAEDGVVKSTPISSIKKCLNGDKVVQKLEYSDSDPNKGSHIDAAIENISYRKMHWHVVAVIKSCTLNGLGDPTGTVGASVHQKVLSHSEFGKNLTIGSVLILRRLLFLLLRLIALPIRNDVVTLVMEGILPNGASTSKPNNSACPIQYADPGIENCSKAKTMEKMSTMQNVTKDIETTQHVRKTENSQNRSVIQRQNLQSQAQRGLIDLSQDACNEMPQHINRTSEIKASLPEWTDDQLDELLLLMRMMAINSDKAPLEYLVTCTLKIGDFQLSSIFHPCWQSNADCCVAACVEQKYAHVADDMDHLSTWHKM